MLRLRTLRHDRRPPRIALVPVLLLLIGVVAPSAVLGAGDPTAPERTVHERMLRLRTLRHDRRPPRIALVPVLLLLIGVVAPSAVLGAGDPTAPERTVHEALRAHGLPIGLLPRGVREFRIDGTGRFEVRLVCACSARFENEVHYEANITGTLSYGQIGAVSGISAQELFLWFPVRGIRVDVPSSGLIYFDVGVVYKRLSLSLFETPPECTADSITTAAATQRDGRDISLVLDKIKSGIARYELDQKAAQRIATL